MSETRSPGRSRYLTGAGGTRLHYRAWPLESPKAALLVVHGLAEYSRRYEQLATTMAGAGIATYGLDLRGHGASDGPRGYVDRFEQFLEDVERFRRDVAGTLPEDVPRFLLGHSMGGLIGLRYLEERQPPLAGAIITSPWLGLVDEPSRATRMLAAVLDRVWPSLALPSGLDPEDLSHDPERVADYRDDPEIFTTITPRLARQVDAAIEAAFRRTERIHVPVLFLLAGADPIVDPQRSLELARALRGPDVTINVLDGYYHEVLQEVGRTAVMAEIVEWIEQRSG